LPAVPSARTRDQGAAFPFGYLHRALIGQFGLVGHPAAGHGTFANIRGRTVLTLRRGRATIRYKSVNN
jgi:hypothetical protein